MSESSRFFLMVRKITRAAVLLAFATLLGMGCGGSDRRGDDDDNDDSASSDDDDATSDDDDASSDDDDASSDDDDATSDDDDDATNGGGSSTPIIQTVEVCEQPNPQQTDPACVAPACFYAQFNITVADGDGDLLNPSIGMSLMGQSPQTTLITGDLAGGGTLGLIAPSEWPRGSDVSYSITITDAAGNQSQPYPGTWSVPATTGTDDCL